MLFYPQAEIAFFLVALAVLVSFLPRFQQYNTVRKTRVLIFIYSIALTTKIIDISYIYVVNMYGVGPFNIYYTLPLYSCDVTLIMAMVMTFFNLKSKGNNKTYEVINKLITYLFIVNGLFIPLVNVSVVSLNKYLRYFNNPYHDIFSIDNAVVHNVYFILGFLYGSTFNVFNKTYKGFWKICLVNAGITLVAHFVNLIMSVAGFETDYMYTILYDSQTFTEIFSVFLGEEVASVFIKIFQAPIIENYFGAIMVSVLLLAIIYVFHRIYYKLGSKQGKDNLFYSNLINHNNSFIL